MVERPDLLISSPDGTLNEVTSVLERINLVHAMLSFCAGLASR